MNDGRFFTYACGGQESLTVLEFRILCFPTTTISVAENFYRNPLFLNSKKYNSFYSQGLALDIQTFHARVQISRRPGRLFRGHQAYTARSLGKKKIINNDQEHP